MIIRVLYIDDEIDTEKFSSKIDILRDKGIFVIKCANVDHASDLVRNEVPDVIILDLIMPPGKYPLEETNGGILSGLRLLEDLSKINPKIPILIVTNRREAPPTEITEKFRIAGLLTKPVPVSEIEHEIKRIMRRQSS